MALTGLDIYLKRDEYSRFEPSRSLVTARIIPTPNAGLVNEVVTVTLEKLGVAVATQTLTFAGDNQRGMVASFDLTAILDANGITHINRGTYTVRATQGNVTIDQQIRVVMVTADEMRATYCQGLYLLSGLKMAPKRQPSAITGVTITNISTGTPKGLYGLVFNVANKTLAWNSGTPIPLSKDDGGGEDAILIDAKGNYAEIEIDYYALPTADTSEAILVDRQELTDAFIQSEIEKATSDLEDDLKVFLEPTRIATEPYYSNPDSNEYFDEPATPVAFYQGDFNVRGMGWHIDLPYHQVNQVSALSGFIGNTKALELTEGAITVNKKSGNVDVLPFNSEFQMYWVFYQGINFWGLRDFIADFWRYKAVAGVNDKNIGEIIKMIGYSAAISILTTAEQAVRAGITSESISKDGVSRSQSYNAAGVYNATIKTYQEWLKDSIPKHRNILRGMAMVVI